MLHQEGPLHDQLIQQVYFSEKKLYDGFVFCSSSVKSTQFKTSILNWKYQITVWLSKRKFYSHFTKVTCKCECFDCIVEPCYYMFTNTKMQNLLKSQITMLYMSLYLSVCQLCASYWGFSSGTPIFSTNKIDCHNIYRITAVMKVETESVICDGFDNLC